MIKTAIGHLPVARTCDCANALRSAIITRPEAISDEIKNELRPIIGKYLT